MRVSISTPNAFSKRKSHLTGEISLGVQEAGKGCPGNSSHTVLAFFSHREPQTSHQFSLDLLLGL